MGKSLKERLYERDGRKCHYCGIEEEDFEKIWGIFYNNPNRKVLEKERKDNSKGHTLDNCVLACPLCNNAKTNKLTEGEMLKVGNIIKLLWNQRKYKNYD